MNTPKKAIVFGYGEMGILGLKVLRASGVDVPLVITYKDAPNEKIWFDSLEKTAKELSIEVLTLENPNGPELLQKITALHPDYIFSFYYRHLLPAALLNLTPDRAFNMHGSLLPKYRGRAPTNWAIVNGEKEIGATLHMMSPRADAGDIVDQIPVPILENDTAHDVFIKTLSAAEQILKRSVPLIVKGSFPRHKNDITQGSYYGKRTPADGEIHLTMSTRQIHNLVRAVAPPFPGAFLILPNQHRFFVYQTVVEATQNDIGKRPRLYFEGPSLFLQNEPALRLKILKCGFNLQEPQSPQEILNLNAIDLNINLPMEL
ncbi:MAG: formyltransferase [Bdellovibrionaceae bacterium]|nr:formyltransferase [Pseudobdellovibrionaceae bacterium]